MRLLRAHRLNDLRDSAGDTFGLVAAGVVRTDHDHDSLRFDYLEFAVLISPQDVLSLIAADAEVHWLVLSERFIPDVLFAIPASGDRVAEGRQVGLCLLELSSRISRATTRSLRLPSHSGPIF